MDRAERPFIDTWFTRAPSVEVRAWNAEHALGEDVDDDVDDRMTGRDAVFDLTASKPQ